MSVKLRGSSWEVDVYTQGQRFRKTVSTKEDATVLEAMWKREIAQGRLPTKMDVNKYTGKASCWTLHKAFERCYENYWRGGKNENQMICLMKIIKNYWGKDLPINQINTSAIFDWVSYMKTNKNYANSTVNRHLACLSKTLGNAVDEGALSMLPKFKRQSEAGLERTTFFTEEEEAKILKLLKDMGEDYLHDYAIVSVDTGMRASEVIKFDPTLIELAQKRPDGSKMYGAYIPDRKNGKPMLMPVTKRVEDILRKRTFNEHEAKYRDVWDKVRTKLNLKDKCWHTWRHTTATRLRSKGFDTANIQAYMGHKTIATTLKYAKWDTSTLVGGANLLEK